MNIWQFMSDSPWLSFFILIIITGTIESVASSITKRK